MNLTLRIAFVHAWLLALTSLAYARELPTVKPAEAGMSAPGLAKVDQAMEELLGKKKFSGAVVAIARHGKVVHFKSYGMMDRERGKPMTEDAIFRIYSMTKAIVTTGALMLEERGAYSLDDPVEKFIPAFRDLKAMKNGKLVAIRRKMTIRDLMLHTSGLSYGFVGDGPVARKYKDLKPTSRDGSMKKMVEKLASIPLAFEPSRKWNYSVSTDVLGRLVEIWSGQKLEAFLEEKILKPLDMRDTSFMVPGDKVNRFTANYAPGTLKLLDDPRQSKYLKPAGFSSGGGGLVSTTRDYLRFLQMIANGGELHGRRFLTEKTVRLMTTNQLPRKLMPIGIGDVRTGVGFGLGFSVCVKASENWDPAGKAGEFGWGGAASTHYWIHPEDKLVVVTMEQAMPYSFSTEWAIKGLIYDAIEK